MSPISPLSIMIQRAIPMVWDESMSHVELLGAVIAKVNEMVTEVNGLLTYDIGLRVTEILTDWKDDGTLDDIILGIFATELGDRTYTEQNYVADSESLTDSIDKLDIALKDVSDATVADVADINAVLIKARDYASLAAAIAAAGVILEADPQQSFTTQTATVVTLVLEKTQYNVTSPIEIPARLHILGNGAIIKGADAGRIFYSEDAFRVRFDDILFIGNDTEAIYFDCDNIDCSRYEFNRCQFATHTRSAGKYAVYISSQSARVVMNECDCIAAPNYLNLDNTDFCEILGGWINGWSVLSPVASTKPADSCSIRNNSRMMSIRNAVFVPEAEGTGIRAKVRWIDNYGQIAIDGCYFGGENAGFPIIYQYTTGENNISPFETYGHIAITNCQASVGGSSRADSAAVVLMLNVLPGQYLFSNLSYLVDAPLISARGYDWTNGANANALLAAKVAAASTVWKLNKVNIVVDVIAKGWPISLNPYINRDNPVRSGYITAPVDDTAIRIMDIIKIAAGASPQRAGLSFDLFIQVTGVTAGTQPILQRKMYPVKVFWETGASPYVSMGTPVFEEYAPAGGALTDAIITAAAGVTTTTLVPINLTLDLSSLAYAGASWQVSNLNASLNAGADPGSVLVYSHG